MYAPITVVIPAHNEEKTIGRTLESLLIQTVLPKEIIVVNNASTDKTDSICTSFVPLCKKKDVSFRILSEPKLGVARARNTGCFAATRPILACTDADSIPNPQWISIIERHFQTTSDAAVTGPVYYPPLKQFNALVQAWEHIKNRTLFHFTSLIGNNMAVRAQIFKDLGGFDERSGSVEQSLEDFDLAARLSQIASIGFNPQMTVLSSARRYNAPQKALQTTWRRWKRIVEILSAYSK